jgi:hypothetical protein
VHACIHTHANGQQNQAVSKDGRTYQYRFLVTLDCASDCKQSACENKCWTEEQRAAPTRTSVCGWWRQNTSEEGRAHVQTSCCSCSCRRWRFATHRPCERAARLRPPARPRPRRQTASHLQDLRHSHALCADESGIAVSVKGARTAGVLLLWWSASHPVALCASVTRTLHFAGARADGIG